MNARIGKTYDLVGLGELLIDFTTLKNISGNAAVAAGSEIYEANPGGAPANVVCTAQAFGCSTAFIGTVGMDHFGDVMIQTLQDHAVDITGITRVNEAFTTLAFVSIAADANRSFSFARKPGADTCLRLNEEHQKLLANASCLHFGTLSMSAEPARNSTKAAVEQVRSQGGIISFDPNLRRNLWDNEQTLHDQIEWGFQNSNIVKLSEEDLGFYDPRETSSAAEALFEHQNIKLVLLTLGKAGCRVYHRDVTQAIMHVDVPTDLSKIAVDTTGAGDIFTGAFFSQLIPLLRNEIGMVSLSQLMLWMKDAKDEDLYQITMFANQIASLSTTVRGGIPSIPNYETWEKEYNANKELNTRTVIE